METLSFKERGVLIQDFIVSCAAQGKKDTRWRIHRTHIVLDIPCNQGFQRIVSGLLFA